MLLCWEPRTWPVDGGMPAEIADAIGVALTELGTVVGRADPAGRLGPPIRPPSTCRPVWRAVLDRLVRRPPPSALATTTAPEEAAVLLDTGWSSQAQAILVLADEQGSDDALHALRHRSDWRDFRFGEAVQLLVVPGNDGDGALFAAASAGLLARTSGLLEERLRAAGFPVSRVG